jgi:hypothetical protein
LKRAIPKEQVGSKNARPRLKKLAAIERGRLIR